MKALAPLTLDLQPRPAHRSVPVMHANDAGGAVRIGTSQHILFCFGTFVFIWLAAGRGGEILARVRPNCKRHAKGKRARGGAA